MSPNSSPPNTQNDETLASQQAVTSTDRTENTHPLESDQTAVTERVKPANLEPTEKISQTDPTIVRATPSDPTIIEKSHAQNFGKYELLGEIARGGMGVVYRARQRGLDRLVALKMILGTGIDHESAQRFLQEARAAAALDHPNVVPIYDTGEINDRPYFTMALIDGQNLRGHIETGGLPSIPAAVSLFAQIVAGVAHAHRHGIMHRDLKPSNVLIDKDGRPRVTDFGLAKRSTTDSQLTATGQVVGTPSYMAPEQAQDSKDVGPPADVYALGAVLYFILTGRPPFDGNGLTDLLIKVVMEPPVPPSARNAEVPPDLEALCLRCLAKAPADRFVDAQALFDALMPIADQYLTPSSNLSPSGGHQLAFARPSTPTTPSIGNVSSLGGSTTIPSLASAFPAGVPASTQASVPSTVPAAPSAPPTPPQNRTPLIVGLSVAAVLLIGAVVFLATRDNKKDTGAPGGDPNAKVVGDDADKFPWPPVSRKEFPLNVELVPVVRTEADGTLIYAAGKPVEIHLTADRDCRVVVWWREPSGNSLQLFPNEYESNNQIKAGEKMVVPGSKKYEIATTASEGKGAERLRVYATTGEAPQLPPGTKRDQYVAYVSDTEREKLASTVRGLG